MMRLSFLVPFVLAPLAAQDRSAVAEGLARKLGDQRVRAEVVDALVEMRADAARPVAAVLKDAPDRVSPTVANAALSILEELGPDAVSAVPDLVRLRPVASPTWRARLDGALANLWPWTPEFWNEPRDFMAEYTKAYDWTRSFPAQRRDILSGIYRLHRIRSQGIDPRNLPTLVPFTVDADSVLRKFACENVRRYGAEAKYVAPFLVEAIRYPFPMAPRPRHHQRLREAVDLVIELAGDEPLSLQAYGYLLAFGEDADVRCRGAKGIERHGEHAASLFRYLLRSLEHDPSRRVRVAVTRAIAALPKGGEADVTLQHLTGASDRDIREIARTTLARRRASAPY